MDFSNWVLCIGSFDGFNKEHKQLIKNTILKAKKENCKNGACVIDKNSKCLHDSHEKDFLIKKEGIDQVFHFNTDFIPDAKFLFTEDEYCPNLNNMNLKLINCLKEAKVEEYNMLSGFPYLISGVVCHGKSLGKTIGMPTANIPIDSFKILPKNGVYGTVIQVGNIRKMALTHIGIIPTLNRNTTSIETNIIDFSDNIYGKQIYLFFYYYIRETIKFNNLNEVKYQVDLDKKRIISKLKNVY